MEKPNGPYRYTLELEGEEDARKIAKKLQNGMEVDFSKPVTNAKTPKIYIGLIDGLVVYIGYTGQSIRSRLSYGFKIKGENGYYGYKWKWKDKVELMIWTFKPFKEEKTAENKKINDDFKLFVEAIEAELVYLVRSKTGQWPECQNEIHFNNVRREEVLKVAEEIYDAIYKKQKNTAMIKKTDIDYLFDELWPMMYRSKFHKQNCLEQFDAIESCFKKWPWDWDNLLDDLVKIHGIGPTIGSGLIWAANRKQAVPFDKFTMTYSLKLGLFSDNKITGGGYMHACNEVENFCKDFEITLEDGTIRPYEVEDFVVEARDEVELLSKDEIIDPV